MITYAIDTTLDAVPLLGGLTAAGSAKPTFGRGFFDGKLNLKAAPRAAMNGTYIGPQRTLRGTDRAGHCSNWAQWPRQ